tara:strand:+ start:300 stop:560 length:261 start_codon:yes stop_codon:yes gene_type:complete
MARKKKNEDPRVFNLKTKGTPELLNEVNRALASNDKDVPLKEVFSWGEESEEDQIARERAEDEAQVDFTDRVEDARKRSDERSRWY